MQQLKTEEYYNKISCPTCFEQYDEMARVPFTSMFHGCGHTVCGNCLPHLLKGTPACPVCRTPCSPDPCDWSENQNLLDLLPSLKENQFENANLRRLNKKYNEDNAKWLAKYQILTGKPGQKRLFYKRFMERPQSMSAMHQSMHRNMPANWIVNYQFHEATDVVADLAHDSYIIQEINNHLKAENNRLRNECQNIKKRNQRVARPPLMDSNWINFRR